MHRTVIALPPKVFCKDSLASWPGMGSDPTHGDLKGEDAEAARAECGRYAASGSKNGLGGNIG